jgi:general secretion pathway protein I
MSHSGHRNARGFTLVEVIASLALVGIVLPSAMAGVSLAVSLGDVARRKSEAANLARSKLAEVIASGEWQSGAARGDFEPDSPGYAWTMETADWEDAPLVQVDVVVHWESRNRQRSTAVTTLAHAGGE